MVKGEIILDEHSTLEAYSEIVNDWESIHLPTRM